MQEYFLTTYEFEFPDGHKLNYAIHLDQKNMTLIGEPAKGLSEWTRLDYHQCGHCPLQKNDFPHCPIAANIEKLVDFFKDQISYKQCTVKVVTTKRTYLHKVTIQEGLYSIMGLLMATSGCPHMDFLKPMAYFHLPFSSVEETIIRTTSLYLLKQYFLWKHNRQPDWTLEKLEQHYQNVREVNQGILKRIRSLSKTGDADLNALAILDAFALHLDLEISGGLDEYENIFLNLPSAKASDNR